MTAVRGYAVQADSWSTITNHNFNEKKIRSFVGMGEFKSGSLSNLPQDASWDRSSKVTVIQKVPPKLEGPKVRYCFGGLPALMHAARMLLANPTPGVAYVNDGGIPKTLMSGHQAHVHPSEWSTKDCSIPNLVITLARGIGLLKEPDPTDVSRYSYLHFPISYRDLANRPLEHVLLYGQFFAHRVVHNLTAKGGVSAQDKWLCEMVRRSLDFHQKLSEEIKEKTGLTTLDRGFRVYWSPSQKGIQEKKRVWNALGIECEYMLPIEVRSHTLLKEDAPLHVLKIIGDGSFHPETPQRIINYLQSKFPEQFKPSTATVIALYQDPTSGDFVAAEEKDLNGESRIIPTQNVFGSLGHDQVFRGKKHLWKEVPVSGVSSFWVCTLDKAELCRRFAIDVNAESQLLEKLKKIVPAANLCNLHVTNLDAETQGSYIKLYVRVSQGANFGSSVAAKNDLINLATNLDLFFIGDWELISAGTCTRKTWVSNVPEYNGHFVHGLSGIGYSASAAPWDELPKPSLFS